MPRVYDVILFVLLAFAYILAPVAALIFALIFYKRSVSQFYIVAFAFYFGYQVGPVLDLQNHYENYRTFFNHPLSMMFTDELTLFYGKEPFHVLFKYVLAYFHASDRVFAGTTCALYTTLFILFVRQLKPIYAKRMTAMQVCTFLLMVVSVEFYWYLGLRFWTGVFFMMMIYTKYLMTKNKLLLLLLPLGMLFHYVLISAAIVLILSTILVHRRVLVMTLAAISYVVKYVEFGFLNYLSNFSYINAGFRDKLQTEATLRALKEQTDYFRNEGNFIYQHRTDFIFFAVVLVIIFVYRKNKEIVKNCFPSLFAAVCLALVVANIGYSEYVFYTRFYKFVALLASLYLFLLVSDPRCRNYFGILTELIILTIAVFCLLIAFVQLRNSLLNIELWLGNFFTEVPIATYLQGKKF